MIFDKFLKSVKEGREGKNRGIPMGFPKLDKYLRGVQKKKYYICGSNTGVGKTAFIDEAFILNPYEWIIKTKAIESLKIFYYSFEIDAESKLAKWITYRILLDHKKIIDPEHILGMDMQSAEDKENMLSDEDLKLVESYKEYFDKLFENIQFEDISINPTGIYHQVKRYAEENGKWVEYERVIEGKPKKIKYYKPNNSNEYVLIIIDHIGLLKGERGLNKKGLIDKMDEYLIELRNSYKYIPVVVSQFNRDLADVSRQRFKELSPLLEDFKDSGNTQESANVVLSPFSPKRYNITNYKSFNLSKIADYFRMLFILKNRGGRDGVCVPLRFEGASGFFEELPDADEMTKNPNWYDLIKDFSKPFKELTKKE